MRIEDFGMILLWEYRDYTNNNTVSCSLPLNDKFTKEEAFRFLKQIIHIGGTWANRTCWICIHGERVNRYDSYHNDGLLAEAEKMYNDLRELSTIRIQYDRRKSETDTEWHL